MKKKKHLLLIVFTIFSFYNLNGQWLDQQSLKATVLLEKIVKNDSYAPYGTGVLLYNYENPKKLIVVTCAHLLKNKKKLSVKLRPDSSITNFLSNYEVDPEVFKNKNIVSKDNSLRIIVTLDKKNSYIHNSLDIAAFSFSIPRFKYKKDTIDFTELLSIPRSMIGLKDNLSLGDETYFIGFPCGIGATKNVEPIVRSGSIAWLPENENYFLLDAFSYGGNSGSPVFKKKLIGAQKGKLEWQQPKLIGIVVGHKSIKLPNMLSNPAPKELKKVDIDLNIGLAKCVYIDNILEIVDKVVNLTK